MGVVFVDIETTGLEAGYHEVWEVGLIDTAGEEHAWFLPVEHLERADPIALRIGKFFERHPSVTNGPGLWPAAEFARMFMGLTWGHTLVGANVGFDDLRLRQVLLANGACPGWHYRSIDIEAMVVGHLRGLDHAGDAAGAEVAVPWKSDAISDLIGVAPGDYERHTALGDCRWVQAMYQRVMGP